MGLDMYAYRLKQEAAPSEQVDVDVAGSALKYLGVQIPELTDEQQQDSEAVTAYRDRIRQGLERVKNEGVYDPEFDYWRKFNHLHGWMERLYRKKGGANDSFNCNTVRLMPEDLTQLENEASGLEATEGFFFGSTAPIDAQDVAEVFTFTAKARAAIAEGYAVYYDSWW